MLFGEEGPASSDSIWPLLTECLCITSLASPIVALRFIKWSLCIFHGYALFGLLQFDLMSSNCGYCWLCMFPWWQCSRQSLKCFSRLLASQLGMSDTYHISKVFIRTHYYSACFVLARVFKLFVWPWLSNVATFLIVSSDSQCRVWIVTSLWI